MSLHQEVREKCKFVQENFFPDETSALVITKLANLLGVSFLEMEKFMYDWDVQSESRPANFSRLMPRLMRLVDVIGQLRLIIRPEFVLKWLERPNPMFGNKRPCELLCEHDDFEKLQSAICHLQAGDAT